MFRTRYLVTKESETQKDSSGNKYPDILTYPLDKFIFNYAPTPYILTDNDIERFDILIYKIYGDSYYDDLVLYVNKIQFKHDLQSGQEILLPDIKDIESFYLSNL